MRLHVATVAVDVTTVTETPSVNLKYLTESTPQHHPLLPPHPGIELAMSLRMALIPSHLSAGMTGVHYHTYVVLGN